MEADSIIREEQPWLILDQDGVLGGLGGWTTVIFWSEFGHSRGAALFLSRSILVRVVPRGLLPFNGKTSGLTLCMKTFLLLSPLIN